ncbi:MAG: hypothetical protein MR291_10555 [Oscillospiraceae bacterium]|nr:hypothetical protein [Oscillospiraceae bacterium]
MKEIRTVSRSYHRQQRTINVVIQIVLLVLGIMWILPLLWIILTSFREEPPWVDYIFPSMICGANYDSYTVALGMFKMLEREFIGTYYTQFAAAAVLVSIPIGALFIVMQKYYVGGVTGGAVKG